MATAVVGIGYWGSKLLRNLAALAGPEQLIAVDRDESRLEWVARHHPGVATCAELGEALARPEVDAVVAATPVTTHARIATQALLAGCHVLVEKPLATSSVEAQRLVALADERDLVLMVGHTFLFSPRVRWITSRLRGRGIGRLNYLMSARLNLGPHREDVNAIWDLAPHDISIMLSLLDEMPTSVHAIARSVVKPGVCDVAFIDMTFPSGVVASVAVSWLAPRKVRNLTIVGDENMIVFDDMEAEEPVKVYDKGLEREESTDFGAHQLTYRYGDTVAPHIPVQEPLTEQLAHFLQCIKSGERPLSDGRFGARVVAVLEAAERSWRAAGTPCAVDGVPAR